MGLREIKWEGADWIPLTQERGQCQALLNTLMYFWVS